MEMDPVTSLTTFFSLSSLQRKKGNPHNIETLKEMRLYNACQSVYV
jgi:hypothetical protein